MPATFQTESCETCNWAKKIHEKNPFCGCESFRHISDYHPTTECNNKEDLFQMHNLPFLHGEYFCKECRDNCAPAIFELFKEYEGGNS